VATSVEAVNVAVEELSACIQEIASNASVATTIAGDAVATAADSNRIITQLGSSSQQIDEVVKVINDIAEQTNLLALNATIEAARAGESGRGFSVVATEVKDLASETARATGEIAGRVAAIQRDTAAAVDANQRINAIIERISEYQNNIAAAIEEQSITTAEIARCASDAAVGSSAISSTVSSVAAEAAQTFAAGDHTAQQAGQLTNLADDLNALVGVTTTTH
jgi:methyl-accepting chemotaxis protein